MQSGNSSIFIWYGTNDLRAVYVSSPWNPSNIQFIVSITSSALDGKLSAFANPEQKPVKSWRCHANTLYANWLNYYVYQATPYILDVATE